MNNQNSARFMSAADGMRLPSAFVASTSLALLVTALALPSLASSNSEKTQASNKSAPSNPIIFADFSDPDVVEHNGYYTLVASSFNHQPGVPVLQSTDLIHWQRIGFVMNNHPQTEYFAIPRHGQGMWAPCIRYHNGKFWVFMPDPDYGIYVSTATQPTGPWSEPHLLLPGKGIIDPTPMWVTDADTGEVKAYLLHAWAKSRAGFNNVLTLRSMTPDAKTILDEGKVVIDGNQLPGFRTLEGPKFYQRGEYFYIFAPAGGVEEGWQTVFRAKDIEGPYETRVTLEQGTTDVNGPHQGAWVTGPEGQDWFIHFQDRNAYGRIVHMQPMVWINDWPVMGKDIDGNGVGEPVEILAIDAAQQPLAGLTTSDTFDGETLGAQWQWNANWQPGWYRLSEGKLSLYAQPAHSNLWQQPALISQMVYGPSMSVETQLNWQNMAQGDEAGLVVYG
ncbi:glycoside hydrolase family 43 protein, partial [Halioxenophilus aromaticivorans]